MEYRGLQNGSDIRGVAMENGEQRPVDLTEDAVRHIAKAFAIWLKERSGKEQLRIAIGRDSRLSGPRLAACAIEGLRSEACMVYDLGLASTPCMFMSTVLDPLKVDGSIMITASHLPYYRNGMKFFTPAGGLEKSDIASLAALASETRLGDCSKGFVERHGFMQVYEGYLRDKIKEGVQASDYDHPLKGLHVIVDAGNGGGGFFVSGVLQPLGADTGGSQFLEPDGRFPNHIPNPEDPVAAKAVHDATLKAGADLGIIFDTDVDRAGAVLPTGQTLTRNVLIAILSDIALQAHPGTTIVTDSVTSTGLAAFIKAHGGVHRRFKRGYRNVIDEAIRLNREGVDCQLAIETSGHGAWKENYFLDDGAYLMVKLLVELGKGRKIADMIKDLKEPAESTELRFPVTASDVQSNGDRVLALVRQEAPKHPGWSLERENYEGVRVNTDKTHGDGWFLIRKSLHEPIMPLNIESDSKGGVAVMASGIKALLEKAGGLDLKPFDNLPE